MSNPTSCMQQNGCPRKFDLASHIMENNMQDFGTAQKPDSLQVPFLSTASQDLCPGTWGTGVRDF